MDYNQEIPRYPPSEDEPDIFGQYNPSFQPDLGPRSSYMDQDQDVDSAIDVSEGAIRRRSVRQAVASTQVLKPSTIVDVDPSLERQIEFSHKQELEKLIAKLADMSSADIAKEVRKIPVCLNEKRELRFRVVKLKQKSSKDVSQANCCNGCLHSINLSFRRSKQMATEVLEALQLWQGTLKVIGGKFGTSILSYFNFIKWLLMFNIFSFVVNFSFITVPQFVDMAPNNLSFSGLELLTGAGYFEETVLYYGYYTNSTIRKDASLAPYNMQLAYILTIGLYLATCFLILLFSMAKSFRNNFINPASFSGNAAKLLCTWDFRINNEKAVKLKRRHLSTQIKETLSEKLMEALKLTWSQKLGRFSIHVTAWIASSGLTVACCAGVYYLCVNVALSVEKEGLSELTKEAATLLVPVVVSIINLLMPLVYSMFGLVEKFKYPQHQVYVVIIRNVLLKFSLIGILCYYWLEKIAESNNKCWESYLGQDIYRLVVIDFLFVLVGSFFGEFIRKIIGTYCCKSLGVPEFDIARNVLDLIYAQTLAWIGIFFSPLLPLIQMIKLFIIFYVKKVSLMMNCIPPRRAWRASQMTTVFIFLLFFPSFAGVLCVVGVTWWRRKPSDMCGPFKALNTPYDSINDWVTSIKLFDNTKWVAWIYNNLVESVLFFYILTLVVIIISYLYWQIVQGRKIMVKMLLTHIANEGKDKSFLLKELRKSQKPPGGNRSAPHQMSKRQVQPSQGSEDQRMGNESRPQSSGGPSALKLAVKDREQMEESSSMENTAFSDNTAPSEAMLMIMRARQQAEYEEQQSRYGEENRDAMEMEERAKQRDEDEEDQPQYKGEQSQDYDRRQPWNWAGQSDAKQKNGYEAQQPRSQSRTDALAMAMRARQQAELEQ
ncbi:transmembrane channel-like protein 5 isoform X2 [Hyla sarda]|nr:transmembrane channel-like protein 5 isoform X2 [Hyla sarda]XP_056392107.1 transmembrane channel-like protein 5 isoform X2 [Hyla sarda]XP_056392108.1 transmembrane channel-like protein 5 isoform X2 [Hyla sarda]